MRIVRFQPAAEADLDDIWLTIGSNNPRAADRIVDSLHNRALLLSDFPQLGPERPDIADGLRMLVEGNYLILYRITKNSVEIGRVIHGARDLSTLF